MARAIIHNSDYLSIEAAKQAIDKHLTTRNPKRAGRKIWGAERFSANSARATTAKIPSTAEGSTLYTSFDFTFQAKSSFLRLKGSGIENNTNWNFKGLEEMSRSAKALKRNNRESNGILIGPLFFLCH
jgi:hypothetical protein